MRSTGELWPTASEIFHRLPAFHQFRAQQPRAEQLGEHGEHLVDAGGERSSDGLRSGGVGRLTNLAGDAEIDPDDLSDGDTEVFEGLTGREIEHSVERYLVAVQHPGEQSLNPDDQPFAAVAKLRRGAGSRGWVRTNGGLVSS